MFLPLLLLSTGGFFGWKAYKKHTAMTPERKAAFNAAMNDVTIDPAKLRALAAAFAKEGLTKEAALLTKRAALKEAPPEVKKARQEVFQKALNSNDPTEVERIAAAHEQAGAVGAAEALRLHAESLKTVKDA